tara:strand:- start:22 stop:720 length:699 start_codon:yes stop_codon:yes gene_type:complete
MQQVAIELEGEGKSDGTINRIFSAVSTVLRHCAFDELIPQPKPFRYRAEAEARHTYYTKEQVEQLSSITIDVFARKDLDDLIMTAAYTGMRRGELAKIRVKDIDLAEGFIHVGGRPGQLTKVGNYRAIPIHPKLYHLLHERTKGIKDSVAIFGEEWSNVDQMSEAFYKVRDYLRIPPEWNFHSLRHSFATWHVTGGTPIRTIMKLMGHKRIETTLRYAKVTDQASIAAMNNI